MNTKNIILSIIAIVIIIIWVKFFMNQQSPSRSEIKFTGNYMSYESWSWMINSQKVTILDFYAPWCPSCRSTSSNIYTQASQIPNNLQILNVDYDSNQDLRQKYWVTSQHTFVLIDKNWNLIDKTQNISSVSDLIQLAKPLLDKAQANSQIDKSPQTQIENTWLLENIQKEEELLGYIQPMKEEWKQKEETKQEMVKEEPKKEISQNGKYISYSEWAKDIPNKDIKTILFFNASWCPSCKSVDKDIKSNLSQIPNNLQILSVDYDTNQDLRKKHLVTYQHTFVVVDNNGNQIKKISWLNTIDDIINFVK